MVQLLSTSSIINKSEHRKSKLLELKTMQNFFGVISSFLTLWPTSQRVPASFQAVLIRKLKHPFTDKTFVCSMAAIVKWVV